MDLMKKCHSADSLLFATLFLSETERNNIVIAYLKQAGYNERNPLFTAISIFSCNVDELFKEDHLTQILMPSWRLHTAIVLKTLTAGQSTAKFVKAKEFMTRLADALLTRQNDVAAYLSLSLLADSFNFSLL